MFARTLRGEYVLLYVRVHRRIVEKCESGTLLVAGRRWESCSPGCLVIEQHEPPNFLGLFQPADGRSREEGIPISGLNFRPPIPLVFATPALD